MMSQVCNDMGELLKEKLKPISPFIANLSTRILNQTYKILDIQRNRRFSKAKTSGKNQNILANSQPRFDREIQSLELYQDINWDSKELLEISRNFFLSKATKTSMDPLAFGFACDKLQKNMKPLVIRQRLNKLYWVIFQILQIIAILYVANFCWKHVPCVKKLTQSGLRRAEIKLLPYWDWTSLYYESCLISNPFYQPETLREDDCQACIGVNTIAKVANISQSKITDGYLKMDLPFIVRDATSDWIIMDWPRDGSAKGELKKFYEATSVLMNSYPCMLTTSIRRKKQGSKSLRNKILNTGPSDKFFAYWENCEKRAGKSFRNLYKRPYFLPPMVEMSIANWVFISQSYIGTTMKNIPIDSTSIWFAQIAGESEIKLIPRPPCNKLCNTLNDMLFPGEIVVWNDFLWSAYYVPATNLSAFYGNEESLAIASGLIWNR